MPAIGGASSMSRWRRPNISACLRAGVVFVRVAPLKADGACQAAFEPDLPCLSCGDTPNRLPGILSGSHD
jgi:hypothetical protein